MMSSNTTKSKNTLNMNNNLQKKVPNPLATIIKNISKTNQKTVQMVAANTAQAILPFKVQLANSPKRKSQQRSQRSQSPPASPSSKKHKQHKIHKNLHFFLLKYIQISKTNTNHKQCLKQTFF